MMGISDKAGREHGEVVLEQTRRNERVSHEIVQGKAFQAEGTANTKMQVCLVCSKELPGGLCNWSTERPRVRFHKAS